MSQKTATVCAGKQANDKSDCEAFDLRLANKGYQVRCV